MNRKEFLKKGLMGSGIFVSSTAFGNLVKNEIDELKELDVIGFEHLPNKQEIKMENMVIHKADSRGGADHGWLKAKHSFSFANYYNPDRMHFGALRVLNDDFIDKASGFPTHPHDNMEIVTIPLEGDLEHKDSMGNSSVIKHGDVQVMSAGTGILHSEFNANKDKPVRLFQIWMFPNKRNVTPRYDQLTLNTKERHNKLQQILSPNPDDAGVWVHQDAWFHMGRFDQNFSTSYKIKKPGNGVYAMIVYGNATINGQQLSQRDAIGIWDIEKITLTANTPNTEVLLIEVPMVI